MRSKFKGLKKKNADRGQKREDQKEEKKNTFQRAEEELPPPQVHFAQYRVRNPRFAQFELTIIIQIRVYTFQYNDWSIQTMRTKNF